MTTLLKFLGSRTTEQDLANAAADAWDDAARAAEAAWDIAEESRMLKENDE